MMELMVNYTIAFVAGAATTGVTMFAAFVWAVACSGGKNDD